MPKGFSEKWEKSADYEQPLGEKIREAVLPSTPLRQRLDVAVRRIELQMQRLEQVNQRFSRRDKSLFAQIVEAYSKHEMPRANVFANELAELRKMEQTIMYASLALEQISTRLKTVTELGDVVTELAPAIGVLSGIKRGLTGVLPQAEKEFDQIGTLMNGIIIDASQSTELNVNFSVANEDAQKILDEASVIAEQKMKEKFPELPAGVPALGEKLSTQSSV